VIFGGAVAADRAQVCGATVRVAIALVAIALVAIALGDG
jgi:hypothetical protein